MDALFNDRLLKCSDCHGEFIFTAGEQLFFHEKQFKNDPKRCKPCKSRRTGLAAAAQGIGPAAAGLSRTETRTTCSECSVQTTVPFKPTQGRPVLCRQCFQARHRGALPMVAAAMTTAATMTALTAASSNATGAVLSAEAALVAASSMASASADSSVASAADLASISEMPVAAELTPELVSTQMLAAAGAGHVCRRAEASKA